jgi:hypothetical protein
MPRDRYIRRDRSLRTAGQLITALDKCDPTTGKTYWELARRRGPRIRKFARYPRPLKAWQRKLNEPSHFSTKFRKVDEAWLRAFVGRVRQWFDDKDKYLIVAAVNELFSQGRIQATLKADPDNTPGVREKIVVGPGNLERDERGSIKICGPKQRTLVISDAEVPRGPWPRALVLVQGCVGMGFEGQFVTKRGDAVDISSMTGVLESFAKTRGQRAALTKRLRKLGFEITWGSGKGRT